MQFICQNCGKFVNKKGSSKYCNNKCQMEHQTRLLLERWLSGEECGWTGKTRQLKEFVRRHIFEVRGTACERCSWDVRHEDGSILTEIDHIDGNSENCIVSNLRVLCPNCHAQTHTFRNRNTHSKRDRK